MENLLTFALIVVCFLVVAIIAYALVTNKIIKDQERDIEILKTDNERLRSYIRGARYVKKIVYGDCKINNPDPAKVTNDLFKEW